MDPDEKMPQSAAPESSETSRLEPSAEETSRLGEPGEAGPASPADVESFSQSNRITDKPTPASEEPEDEEEWEEEPRGTRIPLAAMLVIALLTLLIGLAGGYFLGGGVTGQRVVALVPWTPTPRPTVPPTAEAQPTPDMNRLLQLLITKTRHFKGNDKAPVTMIEFADFQCPFCGQYFNDAGKQIDDKYVKDGTVRFGYINLAFLGDESQWAAEAAECASDQNKYWEYHDKLFSSQSGENKGAFAKDKLKGFAADLGLDQAAFATCLDSGKYTQLVQEDTQFISSLGVQSTPTFLVNTTPVQGAQSFATFSQIIEKAKSGQ